MNNQKAVALAVAAVLYGACGAVAEDKIWVGPHDGLWSARANWSPAGQPAPGDNATLTYSINSLSATIFRVNYFNLNFPNPGQLLDLVRLQGINTSGFAFPATMILQQEQHNLRAVAMQVGFSSGGWGQYDLMGGLGEFSILTLGLASGSNGTFNLSGGTANINGSTGLVVGHDGIGTLNHTGGSLSTSHTRIGRFAGSSGSMSLSGAGTTWNNLLTVSVGGFPTGAGGTGSLSLSGGAQADIGDALRIWNNGTFTMSGSGTRVSAPSLHVIGGTATRSSGRLLISSSGTTNDLATFIGLGTGTGTLNVAEGGTFNGGSVNSLARTTTSTAVATVTGAGSAWNGTSLYIGGHLGTSGGTANVGIADGGKLSMSNLIRVFEGGTLEMSGAFSSIATGTLDIRGGAVTRTAGQIAISSAGTTGLHATVIGIGSGTGTLNITEGGTFSAGAVSSMAVDAAATGSATVSGTDSLWSGSTLNIGGHGITPGGTASASISDGGTLHMSTQIRLFSAGSLALSGATSQVRTGGLDIRGGSVTRSSGQLAVSSTGTTTGAGTFIGLGNGTGTVSITNGGWLSAGDINSLARDANSTANVTVTGEDSRWTGSRLAVGGHLSTPGGTASVSITDGAQVTMSQVARVFAGGSMVIGEADTERSGMRTPILEVRGGTVDVMTFNGQLDISTGPLSTATVAIGPGAGSGTLVVTDGGVLNGGFDYMAMGAGSTATATITGSGSAWDGIILEIGGTSFESGGAADVVVSGGGRIRRNGQIRVWADSSLTIEPFGSEVWGSSLRVRGGTVERQTDTRMVIASDQSSTPPLGMFVGQGVGGGIVDVWEGGTLQSGVVNSLARHAGSTATVSISGTGSTWSGGRFDVGGHNDAPGGTATVTISDGGRLEMDERIRIFAGGSVTQSDEGSRTTAPLLEVRGGTFAHVGGSVMVSNTGTSEPGRFTVGSDGGSGAVHVSEGGSVTSGWVQLGRGPGSVGMMTLTGSGTTWDAATWVDSLGGHGTLEISDGAMLTSASGAVGSWLAAAPSGTATVNITGTNSRWTDTGSLFVGGSNTHPGGAATINVDDAGRLFLGGPMRVWDEGAVTVGPEFSTYLRVPVLEVAGGTVTQSGSSSLSISPDWIAANPGTWIGIGMSSGTLLISDGGALHTTFSTLRPDANHTGTATVTGAGSIWTGTGLSVNRGIFGPHGTSAVTIADGATLSMTDFIRVYEAGGSVHYLGGTIETAAVELHNSGRMLFGPGGDKTLTIDELFIHIAQDSSMDLADNELIVNVTPLAEVHDYVAWGYGFGTWNGPAGIKSSVAAGQTGRALGVVPYGSGTRVAFTWGGDANLDGQVTIADLGILAANWQQTDRFWFQGDFNYDGVVNIVDLGILAANWQAGVSGGESMTFAEAMAIFDMFDGVVVPEPSSLALLAASLLLRRRKKQPLQPAGRGCISRLTDHP